MPLSDNAGYLPAIASVISVLGTLWRLARRRPPSAAPCSCSHRPPGGENGPVTRWVLRYEAADGGVLTAWVVGPARAVRGEEHARW